MSSEIQSIASYAKTFGLSPLKSLGQNFIYDKSLCDKIVSFGGNIKDKEILEIGAGPGGLTRSIAHLGPKRLIVIEKDPRSCNLLNDLKKYYNNIEIIHADALKIKLSEINLTSKLKIIANLPYNIGTQLIINWSKEISYIDDITVMLQKEVVNRICSNSNVKEYGRLSIIMQLLFSAKKLFDVSKDAFYPKPKVTSSLVKLIPRDIQYKSELIEILEKVTQIAFSNRRKKISNSLGKAYDLLSVNFNDILLKRPEQISPELYIKISKKIYDDNFINMQK